MIGIMHQGENRHLPAAVKPQNCLTKEFLNLLWPRMKIYLLLAHPDINSFNGQIADTIEEAMRSAGHQVRRQNIGQMRFDPVLWHGYAKVQELEEDLLTAQQNILWCEKWLIIYPVWWGSVPAIFKGFLDRTLTPGFAFNYHEKDPLWDGFLEKRSAHIIATSDAPAIWLWWRYRNSDIGAIRRATLEFCGIKPVKVSRIGRVKYLKPGQRKVIIARLARQILPN